MLATLGLVVAAIFSAMAYVAASQPERLTCEAGLNVEERTATTSSITCRVPSIEATCSKGSYVRIENTIHCVTGDGRKYDILDNSDANASYCEQAYGEGSYPTGKRACSCTGNFELRNGRCVDLKAEQARIALAADHSCKEQLGPHARVVPGDNAHCKCEPGFVMGATGEGCISTLTVCQRQFGLFAEPPYPDSDKCKCRVGFVWSKDGTECVCPDGKYEKDGDCVDHPKCGTKGRFDPALERCVCSDEAELVDGICLTPDEQCHKRAGIFSLFNRERKRCECRLGYMPVQGRCESLSDYCRSIYGPRASSAFGKDNACRCSGDPCRCSKDAASGDQTPCI